MCGGLNKDNEFSPKLFELHKVAFDDFAMQCKMGNTLFENEDLVVKIGEQYYDWKTASSIIMCSHLYGRCLPSDVIEEMKNRGRSMQKNQEVISATNEATNLNTEANSNEQGKNTSWWPFGLKGNTEESMAQDSRDKGSPDRDIAAAFAAAAGATEINECNAKVPTTSTPEVKTEHGQNTADKSSQISESEDQVDNKSQQLISEQETSKISLDQGSISDPLLNEKSASTIIDMENTGSANFHPSNLVEKVSSSAQTGESLLRTPPRIPRIDANVSTSSGTSHNDDVLKRENIVGKFKKSLRLPTESIVSIFKLLLN